MSRVPTLSTLGGTVPCQPSLVGESRVVSLWVGAAGRNCDDTGCGRTPRPGAVDQGSVSAHVDTDHGPW